METTLKAPKAKNPAYMMISLIRLVFAVTFTGMLVLGIANTITTGVWAGQQFWGALTMLVGFALTLIPTFIERKDLMVMPPAFQAVFSAFVFLAMFLGEFLHFYDRFAWWDVMLHFASGIMFALVGYMLFLSLNRDRDVRKGLNPISVILLVVCFSMACGMAWEIFEFAGDSLLGMNMQRWQNDMTPAEWAALQNIGNASNPGLMDTMKDIINDTVGTILSIFVILPMVKRENAYKKANITCEELMADTRPQNKGAVGGRVREPAFAPSATLTEIPENTTVAA